MKKLRILLITILVMGLWVGAASAQLAVSRLNEPGSMLVFPLIDNINYNTIIEITNRSQADVWLEGYMIVHPPGAPHDFTKKSFFIHLTQKEVFWWDTGTVYNRTDASGVLTQIQSFNNYKGFCFVWAVDSEKTAIEIDWDWLKGDGLVYGNPNRAFRYNAIPHQALAIVGDRLLNLDGVEYTAAPSQVMCEGFAEGFSGAGGTWAVANLGIDFINSTQPDFDINLLAWNQNEVPADRHLAFDQFEQYDLTTDLQLAIGQVFTPKWHFASTSTGALWTVFFQWTGGLMWGGQCFQHPDSGVATTVVLPPIPVAAQ
jgi:hypothetical protein